MLGSHPHGIMCVGSFCNFSTESTSFSQKFPGIRPSLVALNSIFHLPLYRDYLMSSGELPAEWEEVPSGQSSPHPLSSAIWPEHGPGSQTASVNSFGTSVLAGTETTGRRDMGKVDRGIWKEWDAGFTLQILKDRVRGWGAKEGVVTAPHLLLPAGMCSANCQSLDFILSRPQLGQAAVIAIGGAQESLYAMPGKHHLVLRNRKGFVRLALRHG